MWSLPKRNKQSIPSTEKASPAPPKETGAAHLLKVWVANNMAIMGDPSSEVMKEYIRQFPDASYQDIHKHVFDQNTFAWRSASNQRALAAAQEKPNVDHSKRAFQMLVDRLGGVEGPFQIKNDQFMHCHVQNGNVYFFAVVKGEPIALCEGAALFPSDTFVTQIRMLLS